jgi:hypothetical protein
LSSSTERYGAEADEPEVISRPQTGEERFLAMSVPEQEAAVGVELAAAIRKGEVKISELEHADPLGRVTAPDAEDVL